LNRENYFKPSRTPRRGGRKFSGRKDSKPHKEEKKSIKT
jgi:hypothetical protein